LQQVLAQAPAGGWGGIVALTDGLDTSSSEKFAALDETTRRALTAGTPLFLVPGRNRYAGGGFVTLRDLTVPPQVLPRSRFRFEVTLDSYQTKARSLPLRLRVGETLRAPETLQLEAGRRLVTWSAEIEANQLGVLPVQLQIGELSEGTAARAEVKVAAPESTRILYYQGALDWGYRFLADILRRDTAFTLQPIFNLTPTKETAPAALPTGALASLPATVAGYAAYDIVVLSNARAVQFSAAQQSALVAWVKAGGIVLFLAPDDESSQGYAGTELEKMLPVIFAPPRNALPSDPRVKTFREQMRALSGDDSAFDAAIAPNAPAKPRRTTLSTFAWEPRARPIFGSTTEEPPAPLFLNYARVVRAKPGAEVLARHPEDRALIGDEKAILLAIQRYGRGQSAVLTSDALWRWKLNQPSTARGVELFWQTLLAWLNREHSHGPRFEQAPFVAERGSMLALRVSGADEALSLVAELEGAENSPRVTLPTESDTGGARVARWTPPTTGTWRYTATDAQGRLARHWVAVGATLAGESSNLPTDESVLQTLAQRTGGAVLEDAVPTAWQEAATVTPTLLNERRSPLWHAGYFLGAVLGLYGAELMLRRRWHLL
jgi:uncharacterized membrane protein